MTLLQSLSQKYSRVSPGPSAQKPTGKTRAACAFAILWISILAMISYYRAAYYSTEFAFSNQWQLTSPLTAGPFDGLGRIAQEQHQPRLAIDAYQKALALEPNDATARNNLANLLADIGDFPGASQQYEWLLHNPTTGADPVATLTNYAQLLGQEAFTRHDPTLRDRAHQMLEQAITLRPDYAQAHYILGLWNTAFGPKQAAIRQLKIALNLKPDWKEVEEKLQTLEQSPATQP
jgi:protein O-GlcNAc transferase